MKYLSILFLLLTQLATAQTSRTELTRTAFSNPLGATNQSYIRMLNMNNDLLNEEAYYVFDDWKPMTAVGLDGNLIEVDSANYFMGNNSIIFYLNGEAMMLHPHMINSALINMKVFVPLRDHDENRSELSFYELLADGPLKLLRHWEAEEKKVSNNPMGIADSSKSKVVRKTKLYYIDKDEDIIAVPRKRKDILQLFRRKANSVVDFAKSKDLSPKSEDDLILLFQYYNSLFDEK